MTEPREVIEAVRTRLREKGWCQGHYSMADGKCCLVGAFNRVPWEAAGAPIRSTAILAVQDEAAARGFESITRFNDAPGRTFAEIEEFLDAAGDRAQLTWNAGG